MSLAREESVRKAYAIWDIMRYRHGNHRDIEHAAELLDKYYNDALERAAQVAMGWTGDINTVENAHVVTETCRGIAAAIRKLKD